MANRHIAPPLDNMSPLISRSPRIKLADKSPETFVEVGWRERIGPLGLLLILGGILLQLGVLVFLAYLWSQQGSEHGSGVWRTIVRNDWMTRVITLSSTAIRTAVGLQLGVCTALVAGLILETASTRFEDAPTLSILRAYNSGPFDIVWLAVKRLRADRYRPSWLEFLAASLFLSGLALQLTSTVLVSDLDDITINSDPANETVAVYDTSGLLVQANGYYLWTKSPGIWPTFAEARDGNRTVTADISDTGNIIRALLPFQAQDRLVLRSYEGLAVTQQARTVCVPADLGDTTLIEMDGIGLMGTVSAPLDAFHHAGFLFESKTMVPFTCPFYKRQTSRSGAKALHRDGSMVVALCTIGDEGFQRFLLIKALGSYSDWSYALSRNQGRPSFQRTGTPSINGWANYAVIQSPDTKLAASVCGFNFDHTIQQISASTPTELKEFPLQWNYDTERWNTGAILKLLGVTNETIESAARGILHLDAHKRVKIYTAGRSGDTQGTTRQMSDAFNRGLPALFNQSLIFCTHCAGLTGNEMVHPAHVILMQAALRATDNPAAALDGLWASFTQTMYTSAIGQFDGAGSATVVRAITVRAPRRWVGFVAAAALLACHVVLTLLVVGFFAKYTAHSFRGGAWQAIAQAAEGDEVKEVLAEVTAWPDVKVTELIESKKLTGVGMGTQVDVGTGKVSLVKRGCVSRKDGTALYNMLPTVDRTSSPTSSSLAQIQEA
ncbi:hypothetical protein F5144DRAFT_47464 [Chaetomium tenue]|uniref:Uncharacterized protein n=1 Tax=Chaetomium tenue TaxID=1854479 RepID=A0ACB7PR39_9PEZI|nr:hypothetical protein F5144DRAFT_47464 [Chaetomium globosum]